MLYYARTGMPAGIPTGAICVQRFDDSLNSAIRITYRISLRSSSMPEPRDPLLKVLTGFFVFSASPPSPRGGPGGSRPPPPARAGRLRGCWSRGLRRAPAEAGRRPLPGAARRRKFRSGTRGFRSASGDVPRFLLMIPPLVHQRRPCYDFYFL